MIHFRKGILRDLSTLVHLELTAQEFPLSADQIKTFLETQNQSADIAVVASRAVGYTLSFDDKKADEVIVNSIGVLPEFRRVGVGTKLITNLANPQHGPPVRLRIEVPSYTVEDLYDTYNLEHWLWKTGFKAVGTRPGCWRYGKNYDWYKFVRNTNV